uniref:Nucleolar protein 16 n=1 Tax=Equus caballus TaxID=9796 RepID=A0A9L0RQM1_HORSE
MPKAKGKTRRQKFGYNVNRKRLNRNARRKAAPRIECSHIRHAWDHAKSVRQNLAEMGLAMDPNKAVPLRKRKVKAMEVDVEERPKELVRKPYVLNDLQNFSSSKQTAKQQLPVPLPQPLATTSETWRQKPASQKRKEIHCLGTLLTMCATWWRTTGRTIRLWPGMRRIIIKIPQNRFGIRSTSINVFTQQSGKPLSILCRRIRWRLNDWFTPAPG